MPPRTITFTSQVWEARKLTSFKVTKFDVDEGLTIEINKGVLNSIFIASLVKFLVKCKKLDVKVQINTKDSLTKRSLDAIGVTRLADLD